MKFFAMTILALSTTALAHAQTDDGEAFSHWGIGPAITYDAFNRAEVSNVTVDSGGFVRGDAESNADVGLVFELHYMVQRNNLTPLQPDGDSPSGLCGGHSLCGSGPFIAAQTGSDNIIESLGGGWMWGFRRNGESTRVWGASQFNIGVGVMINPNNTVLDEGFYLNQPLPAGETIVRTHEDAQAELMILLSVSP